MCGNVAKPYLRNDLNAAFGGRDPFEVVWSLEGETFRAVKTRRTIRFEMNGAAYFAKIHEGVGWGEICKNLASLKAPVTGARNEYDACRRLAARRVAAPRLAAFGRRGWNPARERSFVVCDALEGYVSLEDLTNTWATSPPSAALRRALVLALADLTRALHGAGVNHRDYYLCHILAHQRSLEGGQARLALIDLHRAQVRRRTPRRWLLRDLAALLFSTLHLHVSRTDRFRFIARYTGRPLRQALRRDRRLWRRVERRAERLFAKAVTLGIAPERPPS